MYLSHRLLIIQFLVIGFTQCGQAWSRSNSEQSGKLKDLDVICGKDHMTVRAEFDGPFNGIVSSKGSWGQGNCVYVKSHSGVQHATFKVMYNECGTKPDLQGKYYENTVIIQYGTDIIEAMDEAKRLRCEWFEAYEKPATFRPAIPVADLDIIEMNFQGDDIDCWMEIQEGNKGPYSRPINRIVPVGAPMTIVIAIADQSSQFDMRVKSCFAHDGIKPPVQLTDEYGCVLRKSMLSEFSKIRGTEFRKNLGDNALALNGYLGKATVISYAHFYAFKFPDSMSVQMQCTVEVCRNGCPSACDTNGYQPGSQPNALLKPKISFNQSPNRKNEQSRRDNSNQRGGSSTRKNQPQNYDHLHEDLVLDDDVALTAAESNQQPAVIPLELQNHRHALEEADSSRKENGNTNQQSSVNLLTANSNENANDIRLNKDQHLLITTTPKSIYKLNEDALQHENSKLISELKFAGMDFNRLADTLLNNKQPDENNLNSLNTNSMSKQTDQALLDLPSLTSHIQRLQNDHLEKVFQNERLRELALESGLKLSQLNELLPQAQPLIKTSDNNTIDFDNLLNSVNNLISSSNLASSTPPFVASTSTTTQSPPVTEIKDIYLDEDTAPDDMTNPVDEDLNERNMKQIENQEKNTADSQVNVRVLDHQFQDNQYRHEPLPKNQPSYIVENSLKLQTPTRSNFKAVSVNEPSQSKPSLTTSQLSPVSNKDHSYHQQLSNSRNRQQSLNYQNGLLHTPNIIQPLIHHQHHQPIHFQYLPPTFNQLPINSLPINLNTLNAFNGLNGLPINILPPHTSPLLPSTKPPKQKGKFANLFKQNSLTQYGYSILQSFKKDNTQNSAASGLLSLFPSRTTRALRVGRNARMQAITNNKLRLVKVKNDQSNVKIRTRRSIGSHVNVQQEFQVLQPEIDMQFNDEEDQQLNQPELLQDSSDLQINESKSLICIQVKFTLMVAFAFALLVFIISILSCIFMIKRYKKLELN